MLKGSSISSATGSLVLTSGESNDGDAGDVLIAGGRGAKGSNLDLNAGDSVGSKKQGGSLALHAGNNPLPF